MIGFYFNRKMLKYEVRIKCREKHCYLGAYELASDAAFAYDEATKCIKGPDADINFDTDQEYMQSRAKESARAGLDIDLNETRAYISSKVDAFISYLSAENESPSGRLAKKKKTPQKTPQKNEGLNKEKESRTPM